MILKVLFADIDEADDYFAWLARQPLLGEAALQAVPNQFGVYIEFTDRRDAEWLLEQYQDSYGGRFSYADEMTAAT